MASPFFSIIVPVYNVAPYLRECLDSILAQTFGDWECLCVDDGSSDESGTILDEYALRDSRFRIFHKKNGGVSSARNLALDNAKGEWVWFVDGDDMIHPISLMWIRERLQKFPNVTSIAITNFNESTNFDGHQWKFISNAEDVEFETRYTSKTLQRCRRAGWATLLKSDLINQIKFEPLCMGEDVLFQMTYYWKHPQMLVAPTPFYYYRVREASAVTSKPTYKKVFHFLLAEYKMLQLFQKNAKKWCIDDIREFAYWNGNFCWHTLDNMFFRLAHHDTTKLLPLWCSLQTLQFELFGGSLQRKICMSMISLTRSSYVCYFLVFFRCKIILFTRYILLKLGVLESVKLLLKMGRGV